jgi:hypothetical protein
MDFAAMLKFLQMLEANYLTRVTMSSASTCQGTASRMEKGAFWILMPAWNLFIR